VDEWVIVEDEGYTVDRFDRQAFEKAMQSLLESATPALKGGACRSDPVGL
jgi:hypothetical protein